MPQDLRRTEEPRAERVLFDRDIAVWTTADSALAPTLAETLAVAGANPHVPDVDGMQAHFAGPGEAYGRPAAVLEDGAQAKLDGFVFDATTLQTPGELRALYDFFHPNVGRLARNGRVVVIGRPHASQKTAEAGAAQAALEGFMRSLAKEMGKKGATCNLLYVEDGADAALAGPLRFFLSPRSAYVDGQSLHVGKAAGAVPEASWARPLEGKVALVTGSARGIGAATAQAPGRRGRPGRLPGPAQGRRPTSRLARDIDGGVLLATSAPTTPPSASPSSSKASTAASTSWCTTPASPATRPSSA